MNFWQEKIAIGTVHVPRFIGGPLDGITDSPFRQLVRLCSREELLYTEMRHVASLAHNTRALLFQAIERPLSFQVSAHAAEDIEAACEKILQKGVDIVDLNVGCPARAVVQCGAGSALMADLPRLKLILNTFRRLLPIPFTIKIRAGFKEKNAVEVARMAQDCGVDAIAIHPRLQTQRFEGQPDYSLVAAVKCVVSVPIIVSGNIVNFKTAEMVYNQTGADGFLIARGIWAQPWKLAALHQEAAGKQYTIHYKQVVQWGIRHLDALCEYYGPQGVYIFRKHLSFYLRGIPGAANMRQQLIKEQNVHTVQEILHALSAAE